LLGQVKKMARIFISRDISHRPDWVLQVEREGHQVTGISCIQTTPLSVPYIPKCDWIFFSSSEGVRHLLSQHQLSGVKLGAMGKGTAQTLLDYQLHADFIGSNSDPKLVANEFQKELQLNDTILFPQSVQTRNSIAPLLKDCTIERLQTYTTSSVAINPIDSDLYIFSSPSNVQSYFAQYTVPMQQPCIAFGPVTAQALAQYKIENIHVLQNVTNQTIYDAIKLSLLG
jgi:uroporphyrinogen-III synthase